jgi:hypothetical protein
MGRRKLTGAADKYFEQRTVKSDDSVCGTTIEYVCQCCHSEPFLGLTGTKKVAHLLGVPGEGVHKCSQQKLKIPRDDFEVLASSTKSARAWRDRGAGQDHPLLKRPRPDGSQPQDSAGTSVTLGKCDDQQRLIVVHWQVPVAVDLHEISRISMNHWLCRSVSNSIGSWQKQFSIKGTVRTGCSRRIRI